MKTLLTFFFLLFSSSVVGEEKVYYCIEDEKVGFEPVENYKQFNFNEDKFSAKINFQNPYFSSPDMHMTYTDCEYTNIFDHLMQCKTAFGVMITINRINLKFALASILGVGDTTDSLTLSHGSCSVF